VNTGNYGTFSEKAPPAIARRQVMRAAPGQTPTVTAINVDYASQKDSKLTIGGFNVTKTGGGAWRIINVESADGLRLSNLNVSSYKWATGGEGEECVRAFFADELIIDHIKCANVHVGIVYQSTDGIRILNNVIEATGGSGIRNLYYNTNAEIAYNHIYGVDYEPDADSVPSPHASIISNRSGGVTIRGNHMHGMGNSSGIMFYRGEVPQYDDVLFENNLIYDTININAIRFYDIGNNVTVRNNAVFAGVREGDCNGVTKDARFRYNTAIVVHSAAPNSSGIKLYNNIFVGIVGVAKTVIEQERNNFAWSWLGFDWRSRSPSGTSRIITTQASGCGNHNRIFENGSFFAGPVNPRFPGRKVHDFRLAERSAGKNFGDPSLQPTGSIGSVDGYGFVGPGPCRDPDRHSAGPYEFTRDPSRRAPP
jgi:hypothetical protein